MHRHWLLEHKKTAPERLCLVRVGEFFVHWARVASAQILTFPISREISPPNLTGTALAINNMMVMIGGLFVPLIGMLLDHFWGGQIVDGVRIYSVENYQLALALLPIGFLIAAVLSFFLKETHCEQQSF